MPIAHAAECANLVPQRLGVQSNGRGLGYPRHVELAYDPAKAHRGKPNDSPCSALVPSAAGFRFCVPGALPARPAPVSCASMSLTPFHVAVQVRDIEEARRFYGGILGCTEGRSAPGWVDFNL